MSTEFMIHDLYVLFIIIVCYDFESFANINLQWKMIFIMKYMTCID